ncbi:acyl carrier protein [Paenibacillus polysaccharolyticus]|uniref:acyl carrier protein n=1 Tax=Paenibacillus TaxID=44249 RepID=UPI0012B6F186|nr:MULTISPECIES: acyl carrier protein [Paenibacillus]MCP1132747.1 acyl carrier protein [Paenibacillus polysaccharolyticus]
MSTYSEKEIVSLIGSFLELIAVNEIRPTDELSKHGVDSVKIIRLVVKLEEHFDISFEDDDLMMENFKTVLDIVKMIKPKLLNK